MGDLTEAEAEGASEVDDDRGSQSGTSSDDTQPSESASKPVRKCRQPNKRGAAGHEVSFAPENSSKCTYPNVKLRLAVGWEPSFCDFPKHGSVAPSCSFLIWQLLCTARCCLLLRAVLQ